MSTDLAWMDWGEQDPYFAVITDPKYRSAILDDDARKEFFATGRYHLAYVLHQIRRGVDANFVPRRMLDFGCGVGRVGLPMAEHAERVTGVDVSPAMLAEFRRNCEERGLANVGFHQSLDELADQAGTYDLVHSCIVFQHIDVERGRQMFGQLLALLAEGGVGAIQVTFGKAVHADSFGQPPPPAPASASPVDESGKRGLFSFGTRVRSDPEMQMNPYNLSELAYLMQTAGIEQFNAQFTDHGGELGVFLFFRKPERRSPPA
jgi:SAM-dependent methyltransferase